MEKTTLHSESTDRLISIDLDRAIQILARSIEVKGGGSAMANDNQLSLAEVESAVDGGRPIHKLKLGAFQTAVFLNELDGRSAPSVQLEKSFTSGQGWRHYKMKLLNSKEIDKLICILEDTKRILYEKFE